MTIFSPQNAMNIITHAYKENSILPLEVLNVNFTDIRSWMLGENDALNDVIHDSQILNDIAESGPSPGYDSIIILRIRRTMES